MTARALALGFLLFVLHPALAQDDGLPLPGTVHKLTVVNGSPYIDLTISGVHGRFLVDTGANISGVDRTWLANAAIPERPGAPITVGGTTGTFSLPTVALDRIDLGHGFFSPPVFAVQDFSGFAWPGGEPQAGLLGTDFLSAYALTLDFAKGEAVFALPNERRPDPTATAIHLDFPLNLPTATTRLAGLSIPTRLDSGAAYSDATPYLDVNWAAVNALQASGVKLEPRGSIFVSGVTGGESLTLLGGATPLELSFGAATIRDVTLVVHSSGTLAASPEPLALAAAPLLARLGRVTLDPFDRTLRVERGFERPAASSGLIDALARDRVGEVERGER